MEKKRKVAFNMMDENDDVDMGKPKKGQSKSDVWKCFTKYGDESRCKCNFCGKNYACSTKSVGTTTLWNHLEQCAQYNAIKVGEDKKQKLLSFGPSNNAGFFGGENKKLVALGFDKEECRKACTRMIIVDELPFSFVEKEGFKHFVSVLNSRFCPPSRRTLARDIYQLYLDEKCKLRKYFIEKKQRVCLTTDTWTSIQNFNYMVITAHFIDCEWKLHKRILSFGMVPDHKRETIGKVLESCLLDWGIEKVFTVTVDNASSNKVAIDYLKKKLKNWNESELVLGGKFLHVRCSAHIINLIVSEGLKDMNDSIVRIRNAIQYVRSSPSRLQKFKTCVEHERIESKSLVSVDVQTRWNSTYLMLSSALKFDKAFDRLLEEDGHYGMYFAEDDNGKKRIGPPKEIDWSNAKVFVQFLHVFYDITLKFSASTSVTSNMFFHEMCSIENELTILSKSNDFLLCDMAKGMKSKFDKYWGKIEDLNKLLIIALVLDPRYKLDYVKFSFGDMFDEKKVLELTCEVKELLIKLYEFYKCDHNNSSGQQVPSFKLLASEEDVEKRNEGSNFRLERLKKFKRMKEKKDFVDLKNEVEKYLIESDEHLDDENFDLLSWWKVNSSKYKTLSCIARDVFAIPVSTVASESAFSTGGRILDPFRSSLTPKMVEILVCLQNWLQASNISLDLTPSTDEIEFYEAIEKEIGESISKEVTNVD